MERARLSQVERDERRMQEWNAGKAKAVELCYEKQRAEALTDQHERHRTVDAIRRFVAAVRQARVIDADTEDWLAWAEGHADRIDPVRTGRLVPDLILNVTGTDADAAGYVTVWPCGQPQPLASNLNLITGVTSPNLVTVKIGDGGKVCLFTQSSTNLIADISGYFPAVGDFLALSPERLLDTRLASAVGYAGAKPGPGAVVQLQVTGAGMSKVPADASAVVLNVTGTDADAAGYVTVWPCGQPQPLASNLNLITGVTSPNLVTVKIGGGGKVCLFTQSSTDLIADISGYWQ